jgi:hypothetical protein
MSPTSLTRAAAAALLLLPLFAATAFAQPSFEVSFGRSLGSLEQTDDRASRQTTAVSVDAEQKLAGDRVRLFYGLDSGSYTTPGNWTYALHSAGATWHSAAPGSSRLTLHAGTSVALRSNGASWAAADCRSAGVFTNVEWRPASRVTLRGGYRVDIRRFPDAAELDQAEHGVFASLLLNLPSRTTVIGEARIGAKRYQPGAAAAVFDASKNSSQYLAEGTGGRGKGMGPGDRVTVPAPASPTTAPPSAAVGGMASSVSLMGRLAQSLNDRTGLSLELSRRTSSGALPTAIVTTPALFFDDGIYDDPFASDARTVRVGLKRAFAAGPGFEASVGWTTKEYRGTAALDEGGLAFADGRLRADGIARAGASWTIPLFPERTGPLGLSLVADYAFTRHRSSDAFYNYSSHAVGLGVTVSY